ncbi:hypothetical protein [Deinococcus sp. AJ005]|uniref:hypothetical protein n=1 Tax=Deinococcus sp. AJ005 TaxID=2652443 RepID=UPI00125CBAF1|nr:hypothetical protein [Deinococcus sp. AJ005]QFP75043.1 hypothetical protein DAAJ005_00315 [Deinococcus sp. AJ005]
MTLFSATRIAMLTLLATLVQPGYAATALQDTALMDTSEVSSAVSPVDQLIADATFTYSSPEAYQAVREQIHARLQGMGFKPRWQKVADFETFTAWYSETSNLTVMCIEGAVPTGWMHRAYPLAGKLTRHDYFPF